MVIKILYSTKQVLSTQRVETVSYYIREEGVKGNDGSQNEQQTIESLN